MNSMQLKGQLDRLVEEYNHIDFIQDDPISIPHRFSLKADIEIAGFIAAIFAWGQRKTIIRKATDFVELMENAPEDFVMNFQSRDLERFKLFKHRTFNGVDAKSILYFLQDIYAKGHGIEGFFQDHHANYVEHGLITLKTSFETQKNTATRSLKHIASPKRNSACKRLNMYLRWMVRKDKHGVDFGLWKALSPAGLIIPLDVHVINIANQLNLLENKKSNWTNAITLTNRLKELNPLDPIQYDYALFNLGLKQKINLK